MRKCEACGGDGPCLWADGGRNNGRYCCMRCHPQPGDEFFQRGRTAHESPEAAEERRRYMLGRCDDCLGAATRMFWQSGGALGQVTEHAATRKGYTMRLCDKHSAGVEPAVWTVSGVQPQSARSAVYTVPREVCSYCGQAGATCQGSHA